MSDSRTTQADKADAAREPMWFFLGGYDLEMVAIRDLLTEADITNVSDRGLTWGAKASQYDGEILQRLSEGYRPVLIEIEDDVGLDPKQIEIVDHHGARAGENAPTSLERIYSLLGLDFEDASEEHRAIAANDRGHVRELRRKHFSADRIRDIREREWALTGVTPKEVRAAEEAIRHRLECRDGVVLVEAPNDHATLIADLLLAEFADRWEQGEILDEAIEPDILIVEGPSEWNLFAPGWAIDAIKDRYSVEGAWTGGALPHRGFWGAPKSAMPVARDELLKVINGSRLQVSGPDAEHVWLAATSETASISKEPGSSTQFILPVAYKPERMDSANPDAFYDRLYFDETQTSCSGKTSSSTESGDDPTSELSHCSRSDRMGEELDLVYERRRYFTEETGNMLYQNAGWFQLRGCDPKAQTFLFQSQATRRSIRFRWCYPRLVLFNWTVAKAMADRWADSPSAQRDASTDRYSNPLLNGFLILEIFPIERITLAELTEFNETFRHLQLPFEEFAEAQLEPRYRQLHAQGFPWPQQLSRGLAEQMTWGKWLELLEFPVCDRTDGNNKHYRVIPPDWISEAKSVTRHEIWAGQDHALKPAEPKALVWSCAVFTNESQYARSRVIGQREKASRMRSRLKHLSTMNRMGNQASPRFEPRDQKASRRERNVRAGDWIGFLNVDRPGGKPPIRHEHLLHASGYEMDWAERETVTYQRWAHWGSLYGFTGHSGCAFLADGKNPPFWRQWRTIYRDQALFLLYERATLFRLSRSISSLTQERFKAEAGSDPNKRRADRRFEEDFGELRRHFVSFANLYQFPLLSTEQQSLEMYNAQRAALEVDPLYKEVQSQIDNAHAYASLASQRRATDLTTVITVLGIPLLVAGLLASLLGMDMAVPYAALIDLASRTGGAELVEMINSSSGLVRVALWLFAVLIVLIPIRLFENRLVDFASVGLLRIRRSMVRVLTVVTAALLLAVALRLIYEGITADGHVISISMLALASALILLLLWPLHLLQRIRNVICSATEKWGVCESLRDFWPERRPKLVMLRRTRKVICSKAWNWWPRRAWRAFLSEPRSELPLARKFTEIIERQIEEQNDFEQKLEKKESK